MKRAYKEKLIGLMDEFVEWMDEVNPHHEYHSGHLALYMAAAAQSVYDAASRAQVDGRRAEGKPAGQE